MSAPKHTPTPAPDTCQICGAWKGLHQYETMLCPKNGREEMRIGVDQQWETTVYKEQPAPANEKFYWVADAPDCFFLREHGSEEQFFAKCITVENAIRICVALNGARAPLLEERNRQLEKRVEELTAALTALPHFEIGDRIKLYEKETTVTGFSVCYNDALIPPRYEIILHTTGRADPFQRSLSAITILNVDEGRAEGAETKEKL